MARTPPDQTGPAYRSPLMAEATAPAPNTPLPPSQPTGQTPYVPDPTLEERRVQSGVDGYLNENLNLGFDPELMSPGNSVRINNPLARVNYSAGVGRANAFTRNAEQNEMSAHHLDQMLASDSPLMQRARMKAMAGAGGRGLMNSSIAQGAAMGSMIDRAQPFALQDAQAHQRAATESLAARNQAALTNAELQTRGGIASMQVNANRDQSLLNADLTAGTDVLRHMLGMETREDQQRWQEIENQTNRDWQTKEREGGQEFQNAQREFQNIWQSEENKDRAVERWAEMNLQRSANRETALAQTLAQIYQNPNLTAAEQQAAAENAKRILGATYDEDYGSMPDYPIAGYQQPGSAESRGQSTTVTPSPEVAALNESTGQVYSSPSNPVAATVSAALPPLI